MIKTTLVTALLLSSISGTAIAAEDPAQNAERAAAKAKVIDLVEACGKPGYPVKALNWGMQGKALVKLTMNPDGSLSDISINRSSGWRMLDAELLGHLQKCTLKNPPATPLTVSMAYKWLLESDKLLRSYTGAKLVANSCPQSNLIHLASDDEPGIGIVVGLIVASDTQIKVASVEWDHSAELDQEALRVAKQCQFTAAIRGGRNFDGGIALRFLPNQLAGGTATHPANASKSQP